MQVLRVQNSGSLCVSILGHSFQIQKASKFNNNEDTKKTLKFYSDEKKEAKITEYIESDNFNSDINYNDQSNITKTISLEQNTFKVNKLLKQKKSLTKNKG